MKHAKYRNILNKPLYKRARSEGGKGGAIIKVANSNNIKIVNEAGIQTASFFVCFLIHVKTV